MKALLMFSLLVSMSCHQAVDTLQINQQEIASLFEELGIKGSKNSIVIIIPVSGCGGCKSKILQFAREGVFDIDIKFIVSGYGYKNIVFNVDKSILNADNVVVDDKGRAIAISLVEYFPVLFLFRDDKLIKKVELNALNIEDVLRTLKG